MQLSQVSLGENVQGHMCPCFGIWPGQDQESSPEQVSLQLRPDSRAGWWGGREESGSRVQDGPRDDGATLARSPGPVRICFCSSRNGTPLKGLKQGCDEIKFAI